MEKTKTETKILAAEERATEAHEFHWEEDIEADEPIADEPPPAVAPLAAPAKVTASIPANGYLSGVIDCTLTKPIRIIMPPAWTGETHDILTFQGSFDNVTFYDLVDSNGAALAVTIVPNSMAIVAPVFSYVAQYIKIRAGTARNPSLQAAQRDFGMILG